MLSKYAKPLLYSLSSVLHLLGGAIYSVVLKRIGVSSRESAISSVSVA
jgi:hypothetical protein